MSVQKNKALARRVFDEIWSQGELDLADELLAADFVGRPGGLGEPFRGPAGLKAFVGRLREGFPDITFVVEDMVAEGDLVATRWLATGTHDGEFMGIDPSNRSVKFSGMTILRCGDGLIREGWSQPDAVALLRQVGAMPELARA